MDDYVSIRGDRDGAPRLDTDPTSFAVDVASKRHRASIAAQACTTCRLRKSRCDEARPTCGRCERLAIVCQYGEHTHTKKEDPYMRVLDSLDRIEHKIDELANQPQSISTSNSNSIPKSLDRDRGSFSAPIDSLSPLQENPPAAVRDVTGQVHPGEYPPEELRRSYGHLCTAHKVILWPAVYQFIVSHSPRAIEDIHRIFKHGTPWFNHLEHLSMPEHDLASSPTIALHLPGISAGNIPSGQTAISLSHTDAIRLSRAYFCTFNIMQPILDCATFESAILVPILHLGYVQNDPNACIALLVLALGQVAIDALYGQPISIVHGLQSGFRGGSPSSPPGLGLYDEARKVLGLVMHQISLENVQIYLLNAAYCASNARHLDFYRSSVDASIACQTLLRCEPLDWDSPRGGLVRRAYWSCVLNENFYTVESDLPNTGINDLEDMVPLPFHDEETTGLSQSSAASSQSHFQYHFLAMIALCRLIKRIHYFLHNAKSVRSHTELTDDYAGPATRVVKELVHQLESWRSLLPHPIQWSDIDALVYPDDDQFGKHQYLFETDATDRPANHRFNLDILNGQLRTRFYYAKFMLYRPYIFKALHFPDRMSEDDAVGCATALRSAMLWPLAIAPPKDKKRLIPHLFTWTKNFVAILLILRVVKDNDCLRAICVQYDVDKRSMERTVSLLLEWIRDLKQLDSVAKWSWDVLDLGSLYDT